MQDHQSFRDLIKTADMLLGTWITSTDPMITEAAAQSQFDYLILDAEHGSLDRLALVTNLLAARSGGAPTLVRLGGADPVHYMDALDNGADGVLVPRVESKADVERAVELCRYPPVGVRGFGPRRAGGYYRNEDQYTAEADRNTAVVVQIETRGALENLDAIASVPELDGLLVGRNDLAGALGMTRDHNDPRMLQIVGEVLVVAKQHGLARAIAADVDPNAIDDLRELGANMVAAGGDLLFMVRAMDAYLARVPRSERCHESTATRAPAARE